jgi:molybdenum ABC transporter, periplasmic molybdate-binding protein
MKKKLFASVLALAMVFSMAACGTSSTPADSAAEPADSSKTAAEPVSGDIYVSAAASMTESLDEVIALFKEANPDANVITTYDSSGTLKTQITEGADCDVFISAAQKQMNQMDETSEEFEGTNYVLQGSRVDLLENTCVLVTNPNGDKNITDWQSFVTALSSAQSSDDLIFAMGNADVPVGAYTSKILTALGLDEAALAAKGIISYGSNVKEVTTQVSEGSADCGIIYSTDAYSAGMEPAATADSSLAGKVIYPAAVMANTKNQEAAEAFLKFLQTDEAMACFEKVGFLAVK